MAQGVAFHPYRDLFRREIFKSDHVHYLETYNASEGFFGLQDDLSHIDELLLMLDYGIFYEFVPLEELHKDHPDSQISLLVLLMAKGSPLLIMNLLE